MKYPLLALCCLIACIQVNATTYYSRASGPWTTSSTWSLTSGGAAISSGYPGAGDNVIIEGGYTVTIAEYGVEDLYAANVTIGGNSSSGTLSYPNWNATSTLTISGDLTIGGAGASASGTLYYSTWGLTITCARLLQGTGSASRTNPLQQDFTFTGSFTLPAAFNQFRNFIINGGTVTLSSNITTNGSVSPDIKAGSTLDMQTYTMTIGGYQNFYINGTLIVGGNTGGFSNSNFPNTFKNMTIGSNSTVVYSYAGNQTIYPTTYGNLTISGSGTKTTGTNGYVSGLTLTNGGSGYSCGASLNFSGGGGTGASGSASGSGVLTSVNLSNGGSGYTSTPTVTVSPNCSGSGATVTATITIVSAATVNGKFSRGGTAILSGTPIVFGAGSTIEYTGTTAQTTGTEFPSSWPGSGGVIINNSGGVTLSGNKSINSLTLTNGILTTSSSNTLTITNTSTSAISGGSSSSFINGPVTITLPSGLATGSTYTLPVGKSAAYAPFALVNPTTTTGAITATVEAFSANSGGIADGSSVVGLDKSTYWSLATSGNFTGSSVSLTRPTALGAINLIGKSTTVNGVYSSLGGTVSGNSVINSGNTGAVSGMFFLLASSSALPVTMSALSAGTQQSGILVKWTISTEVGMDRYEIEKSTDGVHYTTAASVASKGNRNVAVDYSWLDRSPADGNNYYRVKSIGRDGDTKYSAVVKVTTTPSASHLHIYPNPIESNAFSVQLENATKGIYLLTITNHLGQAVFKKAVEHDGGSATYMLEPGYFAAGVYRLQVEGKGIRETVTVLKK